jgi:hypothetical protein
VGELRFTGSPRRKGPAASLQLLLTGAALVIAAAAFLLGRLSVHPPPSPAPVPTPPGSEQPTAPALAIAPAPTEAPPAEPAITSNRPAAAEVPYPSPTATAGPASNSQAFALTASPPPPLPSEEPERAATPTLRAEVARCLSFSVSRDDSVTISYGVRVKIEAHNSCDLAFSGADVAFEVRAYPLGSGGLAGRESGTFQSTIPARGAAETLLHIRCDADRAYRFEAGMAPVP